MKTFAFLSCCALALAAQEHPDVAKLRAEFDKKLAILTQELEAQKTGATAPAAAQGQFGLGSAASKVYESKGGLSVGGYGEFLYQSKENKDQAGTSGGGEKNLDALRLVLYTGYKFSDKVVFNSEVEFEHGGYSDENPEGEVIVEFAYLDFLLSKGFNIRAGQMLVPMGFINELHEPPAFLGSRRPMVERSILPTTWHENGAGIHGELPGNLSYRLYLMNGLNGAKFGAEGIRDGRQAGKEANAQSLAWTGRLDWNGMPGLLVGGSFFTGNSNQTGGGAALRTTVMDLHGEYRAKGLQLRGLYAVTTNSKPWLESLGNADPVRETGTRQWGGYLEAGYDVLGGQQSLVPFARWERFNTQAEVIASVLAGPSNDWTVLTTGVNYKPIPQVAVKVDYQKLENRGMTGRNQWNLALGFYF
ncbi:MAG: hypothetical protein HYZ13_00285 [Acidobacteria bacterium]|nr:hypothetical protein [Acidobacteriota bacterium]